MRRFKRIKRLKWYTLKVWRWCEEWDCTALAISLICFRISFCILKCKTNYKFGSYTRKTFSIGITIIRISRRRLAFIKWLIEWIALALKWFLGGPKTPKIAKIEQFIRVFFCCSRCVTGCWYINSMTNTRLIKFRVHSSRFVRGIVETMSAVAEENILR